MRQKEAAQLWQEKWPWYCRVCRGYGMVGWPESRDRPAACDPCDGCTEGGHCARCGAANSLSSDGEGPCRACGWNYNDALPEIDPCEGGCMAGGRLFLADGDFEAMLLDERLDKAGAGGADCPGGNVGERRS